MMNMEYAKMASSVSKRRGQVPSVCHLCETDPNIQFKCRDFLLLMCQKCRDKIHSKIKNSERHRVVNINDIGNDSDIDFTNVKCKDHSAFCCLFCKPCDQLVCPTCFAKCHKSHDLVEISEGYKQKLGSVRNIQDRTKKILNPLKSIRCNLEQIKYLQRNKMATEEKKIEDYRIALKRAVDDHINKFISDLNSSTEKVLAAVDKDIKTIQQREADAQAKNDALLEIISTNDSNKFFEDVFKIEKSKDFNIPLTPSILMSIPRFVPMAINFDNIGEIKCDSDAALNCDQVNLQIIEKYQSQLSAIGYICLSTDSSLWIASFQDKTVKRVRPDTNKLEVISTVNASVFGMASSETGDLLISTAERTRLQQIGCQSGQLRNTRYDVAPFLATAIHITQEEKVFVGGGDQNSRVVFVMDRDGRHERTYEYDNHGKPFFTSPLHITSTKDGNIHIADADPDHDGGRLVVLSKGGVIINIYSGHPGVNEATPLFPIGLETTPCDNVIIVDLKTQYLHLLDNGGQLLSVYNTNDSGIYDPCSLTFTSSGSLWIGCSREQGDTAN